MSAHTEAVMKYEGLRAAVIQLKIVATESDLDFIVAWAGADDLADGWGALRMLREHRPVDHSIYNVICSGCDSPPKLWDDCPMMGDIARVVLACFAMADRTEEPSPVPTPPPLPLPPTAPIPLAPPSSCGACGIVLSPVMGYVCSRVPCPTGLGGPVC